MTPLLLAQSPRHGRTARLPPATKALAKPFHSDCFIQAFFAIESGGLSCYRLALAEWAPHMAVKLWVSAAGQIRRLSRQKR
jgi:hypothetical protein